MTPQLLPSAQPSFLRSDRRLARAAQQITRFLHIEAAGGMLLIAATVVALVWANSPWNASYESFWATLVRVEIGSYVFEESLAHLVNDLLMGLFFFVVGMEIKRQLVVGDLRDPRAAALPAMAALGGMIVPAVVFVAFTSGEGRDGWGIPMATDIAFALGIVALLGRRVPASVKVLLLTLAIVDDIGAIVVIAMFYTDDLEVGFLLLAVGIVCAVAMFHRIEITYPPILLGMGLLLWLVVYESGVHATIAGVVMGLLTPAVARQTSLEVDEVAAVIDTRRGDVRTADVRETSKAISDSVSPCDRLIDSLHPWTGFIIVPLFALANAGIELTSDSISEPSSVLGGVVLGLVVGKLVGVSAFAWLAVRFGIGRLPDGVTWGHIGGMAAVAGIGFTVSLFVTGLAFDRADLQADAKLGVLVASVTAAALGTALFVRAARRGPVDT